MNEDDKPHLDLGQQIALLRSRGLRISDEESAASLLYDTNYYRLRGYFHPFLDWSSGASPAGALTQFQPDVSIENIVQLVDFDAWLRQALLGVLGSFELTVRARFAFHAGQVDKFLHESLGLTSLERRPEDRPPDGSDWYRRYKQREQESTGSEPFIAWNLSKYGNRVPIWAAVEVMDFGGLSKLIALAPQGVKHKVADSFGLRPAAIQSWLACLSELRNIAAHQGRVWNRTFVKSPRRRTTHLPVALKHLDQVGNLLYQRLAFLRWLDEEALCSVGAVSVTDAVVTRFPRHHAISLMDMGFPAPGSITGLWRADSVTGQR